MTDFQTQAHIDGLKVQHELWTRELRAENAELRAALAGIFEHCALVHKHWGAGDNTKEANAAIETARALLKETP